ncbi:hypothetical protein EUX98_g3277 [Antrodiella citrinella]|uniref:F-box domain-containing protein n=1 Tax=Antrodiella citrinella TaxID=2447956 RepID=A0A4V3XIX7_9APHY|nr:hypothetical protein EUX98_g3277 [Antrodiella citrinella]
MSATMILMSDNNSPHSAHAETSALVIRRPDLLFGTTGAVGVFPPELVTEVAGWTEANSLPNYALVSRMWRGCSIPFLVEKAEFTDKTSAERLQFFSDYGRYVRRLTVHAETCHGMRMISKAISSMVGVQELDICYGRSVKENFVRCFIAQTPTVTKLTLRSTMFTSFSAFTTLLLPFHQLHDLTWYNCDWEEPHQVGQAHRRKSKPMDGLKLTTLKVDTTISEASNIIAAWLLEQNPSQHLETVDLVVPCRGLFSTAQDAYLDLIRESSRTLRDLKLRTEHPAHDQDSFNFLAANLKTAFGTEDTFRALETMTIVVDTYADLDPSIREELQGIEICGRRSVNVETILRAEEVSEPFGNEEDLGFSIEDGAIQVDYVNEEAWRAVPLLQLGDSDMEYP